jgi:hypothetical protein
MENIAAKEHGPVPAEHLLGALPRSLLEAAIDFDDGAVGLERVDEWSSAGKAAGVVPQEGA